MSMLRGLRLINSVESGATSSSALETLLSSDEGRKSEFNAALTMKGLSRRVANTPASMTAIANSATATATLVANPIALGSVANSITGTSKLVSTNASVEALMTSKLHVGKALDTLLANDTGANSDTLAAQNTLSQSLTNASATMATSASVVSALARSSTARNSIVSNEGYKQTFASDSVNVARIVEGELGGAPETTTSWDAVLNTTGRLASILTSSNAKALAGAGNASAAKLFAKMIGDNPSSYATLAEFWADSSRWNSACANATANTICATSPYLVNLLKTTGYDKLIAMVKPSVADPAWLTGWTWDRYAVLPALNIVFLKGLSWVYGGETYIFHWGYQYQSPYTAIGVLWSTTSTSTTGTPALVQSAINNEGYYYGVNAMIAGDYIFCSTAGLNTYETMPLAGPHVFTARAANGLSSPMQAIAYNGTYYVCVNGNGIYYSTNPLTGTWTLALSGDYVNIDYMFGKFIAVRNTGVVHTSTNGTSFTNSGLSIPNVNGGGGSNQKLVSNSTRAFYYNAASGGTLSTSTNGTNWAAVTLPNSEVGMRAIHWSGTNFWLSCNNGIYKSADGTNWTTVKTGDSLGSSYFPYLAGDEKFITSANGGLYRRNF